MRMKIYNLIIFVCLFIGDIFGRLIYTNVDLGLKRSTIADVLLRRMCMKIGVEK
jgi:hypothetical protein